MHRVTIKDSTHSFAINDRFKVALCTMPYGIVLPSSSHTHLTERWNSHLLRQVAGYENRSIFEYVTTASRPSPTLSPCLPSTILRLTTRPRSISKGSLTTPTTSCLSKKSIISSRSPTGFRSFARLDTVRDYWPKTFKRMFKR